MNASDVPIIRPMTLGELLDKAIRLYRQNFLKFIGIYAIPYIPLTIIQVALTFTTTTSMLEQTSNDPAAFPLSPAALVSMFGSLIVVFVQFILVQGLATAALTRAVANNYSGKPVGILNSYRTLSGAGWKLISALILIGLIGLLLIVWSIVPCIGWLSGPGILVFIGFIVSPLVAPVVALERLGAANSVRRAWDLGRSRFWWLIGYAFVLMLLGQLIVTGPVYLLNFLLHAAVGSLPLSAEQLLVMTTVIQNLITMSLSLLYMPLQLTIWTIVYFDLRTRAEGLDLAMQLSRASGPDGEILSLPEISGDRSMPLVSGIDVGRFILLSLIGIALYGLFMAIAFLAVGLSMSGF